MHWWFMLPQAERCAGGNILAMRCRFAPTEHAAVPAFLPVRVIDAEFAQLRPPSPIEIVLNGGPTVRIAPGFDPGTLGQVLAVLEGRPC